MIKEDQVKSFKEKGYLVIENLLPENILKDLQKITRGSKRSNHNLWQISESCWIEKWAENRRKNNEQKSLPCDYSMS